MKQFKIKRKALLLAVAPVVCAISQTSRAEEGAPLVDLSGLSNVRVIQPIPTGASTSSDLPPPPVNPPPVNGFIPRVLFTLTDEQLEDDFSFASYPSNLPGGTYLGGSAAPHYASAILDTGAQSHIVSWADATVFDLDGANRLGAYEQDIQGVGGPENAETTDISDCLGIYVTGYGSARISNAPITLNPGAPVRGQYNTAILTTRENNPPSVASSVVPSLIGSPMASQFAISVKNTQTRTRTIGSETIRTPQVELGAPNTSTTSGLPGGYSKLALGVESANGFQTTPNYFPSFDDFENFGDNPSTPSFWMSFIANVNATNTDTIDSSPRSISNTGFLFDTGAEVSVISTETASNLGIYVDNPDTVPDFTVEVAGVGGTLQAPGFYLDTFNITTTGGPITWHDVPMLVLDITDPRDFVGFIPGIMGTNLFTDRDLIINGITSNPYLAIGPQHRQWKNTAGGAWSSAGNWLVGVPNGQNIPATFRDAITTPQTVNVDGNFTLGSITFDNATAGYTLAGSGRITMQVSTPTVQPAAMFVGFGSHTIGSLMTLASNTVITVDQPTAKLTLSNDVTVNAGVTITKSGEGTLEVKNIRGNGLTINGGKVVSTTNGAPGGTSKIQSLAMSNGSQWDLKNNSLIITTMSYAPVEALVKSGFANFDWLGTGITSSTAAQFAQTDGSRAVGVIDNADWGHGSFGGLSVTNTDILVKYTYTGDANVDGVVDNDDFGQFLFGFGGGGSPRWLNGDFDYNGVVDNDDFGWFLTGLGAFTGGGSVQLSDDFRSELAAFASANGVPLLLPEPAALMPLALAGLARRRRRKSPLTTGRTRPFGESPT